jgi:hypothetical protein
MPSYDTKDCLRNRWEAGYRALGRSRIGRAGHYPDRRDMEGKGVNSWDVHWHRVCLQLHHSLLITAISLLSALRFDP